MYTCTRVIHQQNKNMCEKIRPLILYLQQFVHNMRRWGSKNGSPRSCMVIPVAIIYVHVLYICYSMVMIKADSLTLNQLHMYVITECL